jgi:hypothetical protein
VSFWVTVLRLANSGRGCVNNGATWEEVEAVETLAGKVVEEVRNSLGKEIVGREA